MELNILQDFKLILFTHSLQIFFDKKITHKKAALFARFSHWIKISYKFVFRKLSSRYAFEFVFFDTEVPVASSTAARR